MRVLRGAPSGFQAYEMPQRKGEKMVKCMGRLPHVGSTLLRPILFGRFPKKEPKADVSGLGFFFWVLARNFRMLSLFKNAEKCGEKIVYMNDE